MGSLLQADIFFFITTIAVIVFIALGGVLLYYCIKIARDVSYISEKLKRGSDELAGDLSVFRRMAHEKFARFNDLLHFVTGIFGSHKKSKVKKSQDINK